MEVDVPLVLACGGWPNGDVVVHLSTHLAKAVGHLDEQDVHGLRETQDRLHLVPWSAAARTHVATVTWFPGRP